MARADHLDPDHNLWHWLAVDLRVWREERNLSQADLARICGVDNSTVSNWESGSAKIPQKRTETLDRVWRTRGHFARLHRLADSSHDPNWFQQFTAYERRAAVVSPYAALLVPALLQTPEYARALIVSGQMIDDVDAAVEERMARQEILERSDPPNLWVLIKESVLWDFIGSPEIMRKQLTHLLDMSQRRGIVIRVIPRSVGAHPGVDGSFTILDVNGAEVAWSEAVGGGRLVMDSTNVREYRVRYDRIGADALSRDSTRSLVAEVLEAIP
ncbi:helix-turn-helix domain-containing protein [Spirillospora sp. CA-128828]|uniref:helix-turn-helix domain-containing protein n=1 Tax=Spirillospora sp. CA-128828 TaxID=3240033 RepID=UPI003D8B8E1F